ncbi:hypothetical protein DID74_02210 [Candidatus Marinamargulisbacteria bacterium SCGC AG-333-B06]|nr:hypothetical protein DID74_02210 [Candidatus Marinamargulisbacteria bacterium SCGC AG-333-B06]
MDKINQTIQSLTTQLEPVKPRKFILTYYLILVVSIVVIIVASVTLLSIRNDLAEHLQSIPVLLEWGSIIITLLSLIYYLITLTIPGLNIRKTKIILCLAILLWGLLLGNSIINTLTQTNNPLFYIDPYVSCALIISGIMILSIPMIRLCLDRTAIFNKKHYYYFLLLLSAFNGFIVVNLYCPITHPTHIISWHLIPILIMPVLMAKIILITPLHIDQNRS